MVRHPGLIPEPVVEPYRHSKHVVAFPTCIALTGCEHRWKAERREGKGEAWVEV